MSVLYLVDFICSIAFFPGETIRIVIEDYVQHLSGYHLQLKFDPTLIFSSKFQYQNRIALEFNQLYHWHPLMPNSFFIEGTEITYDKFIYNTSILTQYGVEKLVQAFSTQPAGQVTFAYLLTDESLIIIFVNPKCYMHNAFPLNCSLSCSSYNMTTLSSCPVNMTKQGAHEIY